MNFTEYKRTHLESTQHGAGLITLALLFLISLCPPSHVLKSKPLAVQDIIIFGD
jgi:hypothetical protein